MPNIFGLILTCVIVVIVFSLLFLIKRYKKCPRTRSWSSTARWAATGRLPPSIIHRRGAWPVSPGFLDPPLSWI